jgi:hypothetical protein
MPALCLLCEGRVINTKIVYIFIIFLAAVINDHPSPVPLALASLTIPWLVFMDFFKPMWVIGAVEFGSQT